jgi:diguanylate cyclase (GGDEF)-like protein
VGNVLNHYETILVVCDQQDYATRIEFDLLEHGYRVVTVDSGIKSLKLINKKRFDLVLLDTEIADISAISVLDSIRNNINYCDIPIFMMLSEASEQTVKKLLHNGVYDIVILPYISALFISHIQHAVLLTQTISALDVASKKDQLTGIDNRSTFYDAARRAILQNNRDDSSSLAIALFDIDNFKDVNNRYDHEIGDSVIIQTAQIIVACFREYDFVARISGEEFAVCMPYTSPEAALKACERCREKIANHLFKQNELSKDRVNITISVGIATNYEHVYQLEELMSLAEQSLLSAKQQGKNNSVCFKDKSVIMDSREKELAQPEEKYPGIEVDVGLSNVLDDTDLFDEILIMFYQDHYQDIEKLRSALSSGDIISAKHLSHTLKGVASSVGAMDVFKHAQILDSAINANEENELLMTYFANLAVELNRVFSGIVKTLGERL